MLLQRVFVPKRSNYSEFLKYSIIKLIIRVKECEDAVFLPIRILNKYLKKLSLEKVHK